MYRRLLHPVTAYNASKNIIQLHISVYLTLVQDTMLWSSAMPMFTVLSAVVLMLQRILCVPFLFCLFCIHFFALTVATKFGRKFYSIEARHTHNDTPMSTVLPKLLVNKLVVVVLAILSSGTVLVPPRASRQSDPHIPYHARFTIAGSFPCQLSKHCTLKVHIHFSPASFLLLSV